MVIVVDKFKEALIKSTRTDLRWQGRKRRNPVGFQVF